MLISSVQFQVKNVTVNIASFVQLNLNSI